LEALADRLLARPVRRQERGEQRGAQHDHAQDEAGEADPVAEQAPRHGAHQAYSTRGSIQA
jgi:hypothetical protein